MKSWRVSHPPCAGKTSEVFRKKIPSWIHTRNSTFLISAAHSRKTRQQKSAAYDTCLDPESGIYRTVFLSTKRILSVTYIAVKILNSTMLYLIISYTHASCFPRRLAEPLAFGISRHRCVSRACFRSVVEIVTHYTLSYGRHHCSWQKQSNLLTGAPIG